MLTDSEDGAPEESRVGSQVFEIALDLFFVYLFFRVLCAAVNEFIAGTLDLRARTLKVGLRKLLNDPAARDLVEKFYGHPLVAGLTTRTHGPAYISPRIFSVVLLEVAMEVARRTAPSLLPPQSVRVALLRLLRRQSLPCRS